MPETYSKTAIGVEAQITLLQDRGMVIDDLAQCRHFLTHVSYYRVSGYAFPWRTTSNRDDGGHSFQDGTRFSQIVELYDFDRRLRLHILDAIERIEIGVRAVLCNTLGTQIDPHWFTKRNSFRTTCNHGEILDRIKFEIGSSPNHSDRREVFIQHYYDNYNLPDVPPSWMTFEVLSLGTVSRIYSELTNGFKKRVADEFGIHRTLLESWLHAITVLRNLCAHHSRVWNRKFAVKPEIPKEHEQHFSEIAAKSTGESDENLRLYAQLYVVHRLMEVVSPESTWTDRLFDIIEKAENVSIINMGFPEEWAGYPN